MLVLDFRAKSHTIIYALGFSLNGELLMDALGGETTFADVQGDNFVPACTLGVGQKAR